MMKTTEPSFFIPIAKKGSIVDLYSQDWVVASGEYPVLGERNYVKFVCEL